MGKEKINRGITWQDDIIVEALWNKNKKTWKKLKWAKLTEKYTRGGLRPKAASATSFV